MKPVFFKFRMSLKDACMRACRWDPECSGVLIEVFQNSISLGLHIEDVIHHDILFFVYP